MNFELLTLIIRENYSIEVVDITNLSKTVMLFDGNIRDLYDEHNIDLFEIIKVKNVVGINPYNDVLRITVKD